MTRHRESAAMGAVMVALLCGCAATTHPASAATEPKSDCSFRSPTTCWTMAARFPSLRPDPTEPPLERAPGPRPILASSADSAKSAEP